MNRTLGVLMTALAIAAPLASVNRADAQEREARIVVVQLDRVFNEFYKTKLAAAQIETRKQEVRDELKQREDRLRALDKELAELRGQMNDAAISDEHRAQLRESAAAKQLQFNELQEESRQLADLRNKELEDMSRRMRRGLVEEIREAVREFGRSQGYDAIIDASGQTLNGVEAIVYFNDKLDITNRVIETLNRGAK